MTNQTDAPHRAFLYGQPMPLIVHEYPVFAATAVKLTVHNGTYSYIGLAIPRIPPHKKRLLLLRFTPPSHPRSLVVSDAATVHADDWTVLDNPHCIIRPKGG